MRLIRLDETTAASWIIDQILNLDPNIRNKVGNNNICLIGNEDSTVYWRHVITETYHKQLRGRECGLVYTPITQQLTFELDALQFNALFDTRHVKKDQKEIFLDWIKKNSQLIINLIEVK